MNKKLLTTLLLCIFTFEPICWAEEIIIGADGQARYANQETPMKTTTSGQKYTTTQNPQTIKNTQTQYNYKEGNMDLLKKYQNNNEKVLSYGIDTELSKMDKTSLLSSQNNGAIGNSDVVMENIKGRTELPWYNGNYVVWNTGMGQNGVFYSQEFNNQKYETAFVVIIKPKTGENFIRCYEYVADAGLSMKLKTILIYYKDSHNALFLYDANKKLLAHKIDDNITVLNPQIVTVSNNLKQLAEILNNPNAASKAQSVAKQQAEIQKQQEENARISKVATSSEFAEYDRLNYKASCANIDLAQAVASYYGGNFYYIENNPKLMKDYYFFRKHNIELNNLVYKKEYANSFYKLVEEGFLPKYTQKLTYTVFINETMCNSLLNIAQIMRANHFSDNQIRNVFYFYTKYSFNDESCVPVSEIQSIINNASLSQNDKYYHIFAKLEAKHYNNPNIESDFINGYNLLKQHPEIADNKFDLTELKDSTLRILNYYPKATMTTEIIKKNIALNNVSNVEKFYKIIGEIKSNALRDENKNYPNELYEVMDTGIGELAFNEYNATKYYSDKEVLKDVLSASKILMKNHYWEWAKEENGDIFSITPESCKTTEAVTKVVNNKNISANRRENTIIAELYKEKFKEYDKERSSEGDKTSELGYKAIEKGYYPKFLSEVGLKQYYVDSLKEEYDFFDARKENGFSDKEIESVKNYVDYSTVNKILSNHQLSQHDKKILVLKSAFNNYDDITKKNAEFLIDNGVLTYDNLKSFKYYRITELKTDEKNIQALCSIIKEFKLDKDKIELLLLHPNSLAQAYNMVKNDRSIKTEDIPAFTYELSRRLSKKAGSQSTYYQQAIDMGCGLYINVDNYDGEEYNKNLAEVYKYMKYDLRYNGEQMNKVLDKIEKGSTSSDPVNYALCLKPNDALKILKENSTYSQKISKMENIQKGLKMAENTKDGLKNAGLTILKIVTFPIWIIPALILGAMLPDDWR